jgi:hypothetical protein
MHQCNIYGEVVVSKDIGWVLVSGYVVALVIGPDRQCPNPGGRATAMPAVTSQLQAFMPFVQYPTCQTRKPLITRGKCPATVC